MPSTPSSKSKSSSSATFIPFEFTRAFESRLDWTPFLEELEGPSSRDTKVPPAGEQGDESEGESTVVDYPLAHSTGLVEVIRDDEDHIDLEAEEAAYRAFDLDDSDASALGLSSRNSRPKLLDCGPRPRPPSSIFSHDIWVGENSDAEKDSSFARGVRIVGWTSVGDKRGGAYVVYDCAIFTRASTTIHVHKRYSAFLSLYTSLLSPSSHLSSSARKHIQPLPPRTALARFRPGFLESRRKALQGWLSSVLLHPEIGCCSVVREWVMAG
ncbi:YPT35 [Sanghuangporus weigelae]